MVVGGGMRPVLSFWEKTLRKCAESLLLPSRKREAGGELSTLKHSGRMTLEVSFSTAGLFQLHNLTALCLNSPKCTQVNQLCIAPDLILSRAS
jgi:hypothetical protein